MLVPALAAACATEVTPDPIDGGGQGAEAGGGSAGTSPTGGVPASTGGEGGSKAPTGGTGSAFGGTASTGGAAAGSSSQGGAGSGSGGASTAGSAGTSGGGGGSGGSAAGSGGSGTAGTVGAAGSSGAAGAGGSAGSGGSGPVGSGDCEGTEPFMAGSGSKYAKDALVVAVCAGGTPCLMAMPPLTDGKTYEFKCLDQFNCGGQNPGTTNWSQPPWSVTKACED